VTAEQSGTLQRITFSPAVVTAASSGCSLATPCRIELMATSQAVDFPLPKPAGGFPAGAFMSGSFGGTGNGDTISATGESGGLMPDQVTPVSSEVINLTPGTGTANVGATLPKECTGSPTCKFTSGAFKRGFQSDLTETIQQDCGVDGDGIPLATCLTRLKTKLTIELKTNNNAVRLPYSYEKQNIDPKEEAAWLADPRKVPTKIPTKELIKTAIVPLSDLDVGQLLIARDNFALTAKMKIGTNGSINPAAEETYLSIGSFSMLILANKFKRLLDGKLFTFLGKVDGLDVAATFVRDARDPTLWGIVLGVHGVALPQPAVSDPQVAVKIGVGNDSGTDFVTPKILK